MPTVSLGASNLVPRVLRLFGLWLVAWRPTAGQRACGLWVRDLGTRGFPCAVFTSSQSLTTTSGALGNRLLARSLNGLHVTLFSLSTFAQMLKPFKKALIMPLPAICPQIQLFWLQVY